MKKYITIILFILTIFSLIFTHKSNSFNVNVFSPIDLNSKYEFDINGDGILDEIILKNSRINITCNNLNFSLNDICNIKEFSETKSFPLKVFIRKLSKKTSADIILQTSENILIFTWDGEKFVNVVNEDKNIFGVLDYKTSRTPQYFLLDSKVGLLSKSSYMLIGNENINITYDSYPIPSFDNIIKLISFIEADYEVNEDLNIFTENIPYEDLALLWNLDKSNYNFSFQDAYFENNKYDNDSSLYSLKWRITFEKCSKVNRDDLKSEIVFDVLAERGSDNEFRISSFFIK